jgi:hypothetical protein
LSFQQQLSKSRITKKCTGVADTAEFEINVAGGNPVILTVMLLDLSSLHVPFRSAAGIKIDFAEGLGQNDKRWRRLGQGLGLAWVPGGLRGEAHNKKMHPSCRSGVS